MKKKSWKYLISEKLFWDIIDKSLVDTRLSITKQFDSLKRILRSKSVEELIGFCYHSSELYRKAYLPELWLAPYIAMKGCGDASFHSFRCWLISRGKKVYYEALDNPDSLVSEFEDYDYKESIQTEFLSFIANEVYEQRVADRGDLFMIIESNYEEEFDHKGEEELSQTIEFPWEEDNEESMKKICPKLFKRYWQSPLK